MNLPNPLRTIWYNADADCVCVIDQTLLPHELVVRQLHNLDKIYAAIANMIIRGAPLIGATAGYGMYFIYRDIVDNQELTKATAYLLSARPTAVNLAWAIQQMQQVIGNQPHSPERTALALRTAHQIVEQDVEICRQIGVHTLPILQAIAQQKKGQRIHILTHCNAGMLGCVEWGTATSGIYQAFRQGLDVHVWVDETRPRNQGANLTAWELSQHQIPHTLIADNTGGHLMQHQLVDMVIVGTDRTTRQGDVANKIGTYLKALAAHDNQIPFYVALPSTTIDWTISDGLRQIHIEERSSNEVRYIQGKTLAGNIETVLLCPETTPALNYGFDVTPARLITGLITERGVCAASEAGLLALFPEQS